jgi:hypothetical protein
MLYSVVDDRSGDAYQEYHVVYGEEPARLVQFLLAAISVTFSMSLTYIELFVLRAICP